MIKVSVIIPVYNVERYLRKCLDSIINQTLKEIEIIVINDGSPDNSQKIIDEYANKDNRIKSIIQENGRQGKARNNGLKNISGEYISFIDSDDYIDLTMLEKMYNKAKEENSDIVIGGNYHVYEQTNKIVPVYIDEQLINDTVQNKPSKLFNIISPCYKIYRSDFIINSDIVFKENVYYEDLAFSMKVLASTSKISYVNEPLYYYNIREGSTMTSTNLSKNLDIILAFQDAIEFFKEHKVYKDYYSEVEFMAIDNIFISTIVRVIRSKSKSKEKKEITDKLIKYLKTDFNNYKQNKYIKRLNKNRKLIYHLINLKQYWLVKLIFNFKK